MLAGACFESGSDTDSNGTQTDTDTDDATETSSPDASGEPTESDTTATPTSDGSSSDDSTPGDDPPTIDAFTVDGETDPSELGDSNRVILSAEVQDDNGIDRVEFYDGDTLVGTAAEPPYSVGLLLTSIDNGAHDLSARAFDTALQSTNSDVVTLSVDIEGGSQVAITEGLFESVLLVVYPSLGLVVADDGDIVVTGPVIYQEQQGIAVTAQRWDPELTDQRWATQTQDTVGEVVNYQYPYGQPAIDDEGFAIVGGVVSAESITDGTPAIYRIGDQPFAEPFVVAPDVEPEVNITPFAGITRAPTGEVYFSAPLDNITKFSADLGDQLWQESVLPTSGTNLAAMRMITDSDGAPVIDAFVCVADTCSFTVRKLDPDTGDIDWTESTPYPGTSVNTLAIGATAAGPDGRLATLVSRPTDQGGEVEIIVRDADGDTVSENLLTPEDALGYIVTDAAYDEQGYLVATGSVVIDGSSPGDNDSYQAWAMRMAEDGTLVWERRFEFYSAETTIGFGSGVEVDDRGRVYIVGIRDSQATFLSLLGQPMLVQLNP